MCSDKSRKHRPCAGVTDHAPRFSDSHGGGVVGEGEGVRLGNPGQITDTGAGHMPQLWKLQIHCVRGLQMQRSQMGGGWV